MRTLIKAKIILIILVSFLIGFDSSASESSVIFSEITWMGTTISSNDEWLELKSNTASNIDLTGWTLNAQDGTPSINLSGTILANGYFLLERTDDNSVPNITADQIYTGALGNSGEIIELRDSENNLIDNIDASGGWQAGDNSSKLTMERTETGWQNSQAVGGTPKAKNSIATNDDPEIEEEQENGKQEDEETQKEPSSTETTIDEEKLNISYKLGDIVVNEFVSDPADDEQEFIELYNTTNQNIDLNDWITEEGSGAKTSLEGIIEASKFFIIEKPKGNLNNKGDIIILRDGLGNLIDKVNYGNWNDGNLDDNSPVATDPYSVARKFDGQNTYNNTNDFAITTTITKNSPNIITTIENDEDIEVNSKSKNYDYSNNIVISEILPNPFGNDNPEENPEKGEFIELYNKGEQDINLEEWRLGDNSKKRFKIKDKIIKANNYLVFFRNESKIALNNSGDSIKIYQPLKDEVYLKIEYDKAIEDWSFNYEINNNEWVWSEIVTPEKENIIKTVNHPPIIDFYFPDEVPIATPTIFDSSDTVDEDDYKLKYFWDFGDGFTNILPSPEHTFFAAGVYTVKLAVNDGENEIEKEKIIKVVSNYQKSLNQDTEQASTTLEIATSTENSFIIINEILANPEGKDSEEWIELLNKGGTKVNLIDWKLDDSEKGSKPYIFQNSDELVKDHLIINPGEYFLVEKEDSKLTLNNAKDSVRLFNSLDELVDKIEYEKALEGESLAKDKNGELFWTTVLTPGEENVDFGLTFNENYYNEDEQYWIDPVLDADIQESKSNKKTEKIRASTTLENIKDFIVGDLIKVFGTVAIKPGILGSQYFYIVGSPGIQVYSYKKEFPNLRIGDYVEVSGELAVSSGEMRIKTKIKDDIKIIEHRDEPIAQIVASDEVNEDIVGQLVKITGEVVERKGSSIYFDDGIDEVLVYIKANTRISSKSLKEGGIYEITGIVGQTKSGVRIMPRSKEDIVKKDVESGGVANKKMPGEISANSVWELAARDKKMELFQYLLVIAGGIIVVLFGLLGLANK